MNELTTFPVLGVVGIAFPTRQRAQFRRHLWRISAAAACWVAAFAVVLALNWSGARLTIHAIQVLGEDVSLVEQTIARLKHQQARAAVAGSADVSANGTVPVPIAERLEDTREPRQADHSGQHCPARGRLSAGAGQGAPVCRSVSPDQASAHRQGHRQAMPARRRAASHHGDECAAGRRQDLHQHQSRAQHGARTRYLGAAGRCRCGQTARQ